VAIAGRRLVQAYSHARDARSLNPLALDPLLVQAAALEQLGDVEGARARYADAVRLQPLDWRPWFELGRFEEDLGDVRRAVAPLERAAQLDPQNPLVTAELARVRAAAG